MANGKAGAPKGHVGNPAGKNQHSGILKKQVVLRVPDSLYGRIATKDSDWMRSAIVQYLEKLDRGDVKLEPDRPNPVSCGKRIGIRMSIPLHARLSGYGSRSVVVRRAIEYAMSNLDIT